MSESSQGYTPSILEWLAINLNSQLSLHFQKYNYTFKTLKYENAINLSVTIEQPMSETELEALTQKIDVIRDKAILAIKEDKGVAVLKDIDVIVEYQRSEQYETYVAQIKAQYEANYRAFLEDAARPLPQTDTDKKNERTDNQRCTRCPDRINAHICPL